MRHRRIGIWAGVLAAVSAIRTGAEAPEPIFPLSAAPPAAPVPRPFDIEAPGNRPVIEGRTFPSADGPGGGPAFEVRGAQCGFRIGEAAFVGPDTTIAWSWKKPAGAVCILQVGVTHPDTGATRYLGYGAGTPAEPATGADPTVEIAVAPQPPREWTAVTRRLADDVRDALGWSSAKVFAVYFSPWDGEPGRFTPASIRNLFAEDVRSIQKARELAALSGLSGGPQRPPRLKRTGEKRELLFDTAFEELAPGRNGAANEWSAYGALRPNAFNTLGRELRVRYPACDLVFRLTEGDGELQPGQLDTFRLGLVNGRLPAVWAGWEHRGLLYKVSVMAVPFDDQGAYDLYRIEIQNRTPAPLESRLAAGLDGPPDLRLEDGVVRGLGDAPLLLADTPSAVRGILREWGLCDKRAKSYECGAGPGPTEPAIASTRIGLDGLPVVYRVKAAPDERVTICLAASPHLSRLLPHPKKAGDLVFRYEVEGCAPQALDWAARPGRTQHPLYAAFEGARDADGDGFIQIVAGNDAASPLRHTRLSAIYVFPSGTPVDDAGAVTSGAMNAKCLRRIDVGATPEVGWTNQSYDTSDVGIRRLNLAYGGTVAPGETKTFWLKVPPIHRRQPASMGSVHHAFLQVLPGEAVPPFDAGQVDALRAADPRKAWQGVVEGWDRFLERAARIRTPDPVLEDIYLSRLATRAIHDVPINRDVWFNVCSPWFYYDFAYRDQAYVVYAYDLAGLHDLARRLLDVYCMDAKDVPPGPISFGEMPLQLGMSPDGLWLTRAGQFDAQGQNIWCLAEHWKLSGDRAWLEKTAYPYIRRGAQWLVDSRRKHMAEVKDPNDPRHGLIEPGAMEVASMSRGMHHYYMDAWAVLGLREAAGAARALGRAEDANRFAREASELRESLQRSFRKTFRRTGLYEGHLWFGVEPEGEGMYGFWGHTPLLWPTRAVDAHDPMLTGTFRKMERMAGQWGGGMFSEGSGACWPYIGVDWAIGYLLRGEPEKTLDYFCAFTDTAGHTLSWGEGYDNAQNLATGDQPHFWADAQWINLYRHLFVLEDDGTLLLTPATLRRWQRGDAPVRLERLPTHFGDLDLAVMPRPDGSRIDYAFRLTPRGDQVERPLDRVAIAARTPGGRRVGAVRLDGRPMDGFSGETVVLPRFERNREHRLELIMEAD